MTHNRASLAARHSGDDDQVILRHRPPPLLAQLVTPSVLRPAACSYPRETHAPD